MHLQLRLEIILAGLDVTGDLSGSLTLNLGQHLASSALLPVDDRIAEADAPKVGVHSPDAHALHAPREAQDHLSKGNDATRCDTPAGNPDEASPLRGTRKHLLNLVRAGAIRRVIAGLHAGEQGG